MLLLSSVEYARVSNKTDFIASYDSFTHHLQHVLDSSAPNIDEHRETVLQVLKQIGVSEEKLQNMIEVWNKVLFLSIHCSLSLLAGKTIQSKRTILLHLLKSVMH